jgi:hypothetical protein
MVGKSRPPRDGADLIAPDECRASVRRNCAGNLYPLLLTIVRTAVTPRIFERA